MDNELKYYGLDVNKKEAMEVEKYCDEHGIYGEAFHRGDIIHFEILTDRSGAELLAEYLEKVIRKKVKIETVWDEFKD